MLRKSISKPFVEQRFKKLNDMPVEIFSKMKESKSLFDFDRRYRARFFDYSSAHTLYRVVSCGRFIPNVDVPLLVMLSNDDPITKVELVPHADLLRNKNCVLIEANRGGHCDFFSQNGETYKRYWVDVMLAFLDTMKSDQESASP